MVDTDGIRTRRRTFLVGAAAGLASLAGCSGSADDSAQTTTTQTTEQTTTEPTTTAGPKLEDISLPTGVSADSVTANLLVPHRRALADTTYSFTEEWIDDGRLKETNLRIGRNAYVQEQASLGPARDVWNDGGDGYVRVNGGEMYTDLIKDVEKRELTRAYELEWHLRSANFRPVEAIEEGDQTLIVAEADAAETQAEDRYRYESISAYQGTLSFTPEGRITDLDIEWEFVDRRGESGAIEWAVQIGSVGEATVSAPDWVERAKELAPKFSVGPAEDGVPAVKVDVTGGQEALDPNLHLRFGEGRYPRDDVETRKALADGDTMYVGLGESGEPVVSFDEPPASLREIDGIAALVLYVNGTPAIDTTVSI